MSGSIFNEGDLFFVRLTIFAGLEFIKQVTQGMYHFQIRLLVPATDVVGLAHNALLQHGRDPFAMVYHIEPVPDLLSVAIDRQTLALQGL